MSEGLRIERVELAPWKRLDQLLGALEAGEAWPPLFTDPGEAVEAWDHHGIARFAVGIEAGKACPVSEDDLAEALEALSSALGDRRIPVRVEIFRAGAAASVEAEDEVEDEARIAIFTLRPSASSGLAA